MMPTTLTPDGSAVWVSGDRVRQGGPGTQQGTIRILRLLKVVVGLESISRILTPRLPEQLWRQRLGAESPARTATRLLALGRRGA